jgi:hypothetical protein
VDNLFVALTFHVFPWFSRAERSEGHGTFRHEAARKKTMIHDTLPAVAKRLLLALSCVVGLASAGHSATLNEAGQPGGSFSADWLNPTSVGKGFDSITGTADGDVYDIFAFTNLQPGAKTLTFDLSIAIKYLTGYKRLGGFLVWSFAPFAHKWDEDGRQKFEVEFNSGTTSNGKAWSKGSLTGSTSLVLDESFEGNLYLALAFTDGGPATYRLGVPENTRDSDLAAVPLPGALGFLALGLGALVVLRRRAV